MLLSPQERHDTALTHLYRPFGRGRTTWRHLEFYLGYCRGSQPVVRDTFIYDHVRTPRGKGKPDGSLHEVTPVRLVTQTLEALKTRNSIAIDAVDEVILGTVSTAGEQGATLHRIAPILAGLGDSVPGMQINRFCASGLEAVTLAAAKIGAGMAELMIAGGVESMSRIPMGADGGGPHGSDPATTFHTPFVMQGVSADLLATLNGFSRADVDAYSVASQHRAAAAWEKVARVSSWPHLPAQRNDP